LQISSRRPALLTGIETVSTLCRNKAADLLDASMTYLGMGTGGMAFATGRRTSFAGYNHRRLPPSELPQKILGSAAVAIVVALSGSTVWSVWDLGGPGADQIEVADARGDKLAVSRGEKADKTANHGAGFRGDKLAISNRVGSNVYASLFDPRFSLDTPSRFVGDAPLQRNLEPVALTLSTPPSAANRNRADSPPTSTRTDRAVKNSASPAGQPNVRTAALRDGAQNQTASNRPTVFQSIFEKLFGKPAPVTLAYAATDDAGLSTGRNMANIVAGRYDRFTAVYDISAHTVYMPDGTQLEAHSGLGSRLDDPRHADEKMHGVTPPNIYDLQMREGLFHGVRALRMIPEDEEKVFGRSGLLAHTYMLGPNGDSNGCVSFKNYDVFLQAYLNHDIKRLAVVTRLD
jgi:hypothetical protein